MPTPTQTVPRRRRQQRRRRRFPLIPFLVLLVAVLAVIKWIDPFAPKPAAQQQTPQTPDWVTVELLPVNPYSRPGIPLEQVNGIVIHYVGNPGTTAAQNHSYFENLAQTGETYASSHFLVGLEGEVIQNVPWTRSPTAPTSATRTPSPSSAATRTTAGHSTRPPTTPWCASPAG